MGGWVAGWVIRQDVDFAGGRGAVHAKRTRLQGESADRGYPDRRGTENKQVFYLRRHEHAHTTPPHTSHKIDGTPGANTWRNALTVVRLR